MIHSDTEGIDRQLLTSRDGRSRRSDERLCRPEAAVIRLNHMSASSGLAVPPEVTLMRCM